MISKFVTFEKLKASIGKFVSGILLYKKLFVREIYYTKTAIEAKEEEGKILYKKLVIHEICYSENLLSG